METCCGGVLILAAVGAVLCGVGVAQESGKAIMPKVHPFPMNQVSLLDGPFKAAQDVNRQYIESMDPERLLWNFRKTAGLPTPGEPFAGWEAPDCEVRGHFAGHYLSGLAIAYAGSGDETLKERGAYMVAELAKAQAAHGNGYLSAFPESHWDRVEAAQPNWAQYYTIHKIMAGLLDQYQHCGNEQALEVFKGMAAYFKDRLDKLSSHQMDKALSVTEEGGISESLWNLFAVTGDPSHRALAEKLEKNAFLGPLALEHDNLSHIHGNTHIPLAIGAARHYELTGDERYQTIARYFWERIVGTRAYATGGTTNNEVWPEPDKLAGTLGFFNQECCKTYNLLKLTRHLFQWTGDASYADYYERALFNSIYGAHDREGGMPMYYIPLGDGFRKAVPSPMHHFYCCTGTGIESFAKFGDSIYFHDADGLYVNLFIASMLDWAEKSVRIEQRTGFPAEEATTLTIHADAPASFTLRLRVPEWAGKGVSTSVNGEPQRVEAAPGAYLAVKRTWKDGDTVRVEMPMSLHAHPMPDDPDLMAFMYGPIVLAGIIDDGPEAHPFRMQPGMGFDKPAADHVENHDFFLADPANLAEWMRPVSGKSLAFTAATATHQYAFMPFADVTGQHYRVYWVVTPEGSPRHKALLQKEEEREASRQADLARAARIIDTVVPESPEEAAHNLQAGNSQAGAYEDRHWRHAQDWWSWDLAVLPDAPNTLACTFWGSDSGRTFDILVDGQRLTTKTLNTDAPGKFYTEEFPIPGEWTQGKTHITVKFQSVQGLAGGVFECSTLKP